MDYGQIVAEIEKCVPSLADYRRWIIGVTDNPAERKSAHRNPPTWRQWKADSEQVSRAVEEYFISKGMRGGIGGRGNAGYVYIFMG